MPQVISLASPPFLRSDGFAQMDVLVDATAVVVLVHRSRGAGAPDAPSPESAREAVQFCHDFALAHALLFHALFAPATRFGTVTSVSFDPEKRTLTFKLVVSGIACEMDIDPSLELGRFRSVPGWHDTDDGMDQFGVAFDTCLGHIEANRDEIESLGFDVSEFRKQRAAIQRDGSPP